jgi:hypothetical protein
MLRKDSSLTLKNANEFSYRSKFLFEVHKHRMIREFIYFFLFTIELEIELRTSSILSKPLTNRPNLGLMIRNVVPVKNKRYVNKNR